MIHVTLPTTGPKMSTKDMVDAVCGHTEADANPKARKPSEIAKDLHEALAAKAEQDKVVEVLQKEMSSAVQVRSVVSFSAWENNTFVSYKAIVMPGVSLMDYITEAK